VKTWIKGKLTVEKLDGPDPDFPEPAQNMGQVIFTCGYEPKSTQSVLTGLNEPWMNKDKDTGDLLNGPAFSAIVAAFYSAYGPTPAMFTRDSWPVLMPQEDSVPLPEISTAYQVTREKLTLDRLLKVKAVYTAGCQADLKPGLPAEVEIWAPWDWQAELK
jgi:hypothetical protein